MEVVNGCGSNSTILAQLPEKKKELEDFLAALPPEESLAKRRGNLIQALHKAQHIFGYLPLDVQLLVGRKLDMQQSDVYGVISFYSYFTETAPGKFKINVCTGTACFVKGADKILEEFKQQLKIGLEETTDDDLFTLSSLRCIGACSLAPVVMVNDKVYANVTSAMVKKIIQECK